MKEDTWTRTEDAARHAANALGRDEWIGSGITAYDCEPNELLDEPDARLRDDPWATVCIAHGRFIPCRKDGGHRYTSNPYWVKSVRDYHGSPIGNLTWEPAWERVTPPGSSASCMSDDDLPYHCLQCGRHEEHDPDRCTDCHQPRKANR